MKSTFVADLTVFVIALGAMEPGSRLTAGAPQQQSASANGVQQAPIDLPQGARLLYRVVPLHGASDMDVKAAVTAGTTVPMWTYTTTSSRDGKNYSGSMVGNSSPFTTPDSTTTVTAQIIPLIIHMSGGKTFDPTAADPCASPPLTGTSDLTLFQQSPILVNHAYTMNGVNIGTTQYVDAFQQASFWSLVGGHSFHVLLSPTTLAPITVNVPLADGVLYSGGTCGGAGNIGGLEINWFGNYLETPVIPSLAAQGVNATTFPLFLLSNVVCRSWHSIPGS